MGIPRLAVHRPVTVLMLCLGIVVLGVISLVGMAVDLFPEINLPVAVVTTRYSGAGPEEIENLVTRPVEEAVATVANVDTISSQSSEGNSFVIVRFGWGTDLDFATLEMRERLDQVRRLLPSEAETPTVQRFDPNQFPIMALSLSGPQGPAELRRLADDVVKPRLERLDGVAAALVSGGLEREIHVELEPERLVAYGLSLDRVVQALRDQNLNLPGGAVDEGGTRFVLRTTGEFQTVDEIRHIPVHTPGGAQVELGDIAAVTDGFRDVENLTRTNGEPSVGISVQKQSGANTVQVADRVRAAMGELQAALPPGAELKVAWDQSDFIKDSIRAVVQHTLEGAVLAVAILYLFLRNVRSTLVIGLAIPISILGAFILIRFAGLTLNLISMGGLALGVGRLVDDSIVALENIYRHRERGEGRMEAAIRGASEIAGAITGSTLTVVAVFLPVVFVQGLAGELFRQMALTVSFALLCSLLVAVTVIPLVASRILEVEEASAPTRRTWNPVALAALGFGRWFRRLERFYRRAIDWALRHRRLVLAASAAAFVASLGLLPLVGTELFPQTDQGQFTIRIDMPKGTSLEETDRVVRQVEAAVLRLPELDAAFANVGGAGARAGP
ncbi:MAG: efflux RND transporter permease subunit, partial [Clostridia bacterium]|nr:efflux RND transporter permease subunit [Clostridia bacterium]